MSPLRVLVVEDDAVIGTLLVEMLVGMGHDVSGVEATEVDAVTAASRSRPDLMIVDVQLTDGSGVSAVGKILRGGAIPHVFISGASVASVPFGSVMLQKPFRESDLVWAIRRAFDSEASRLTEQVAGCCARGHVTILLSPAPGEIGANGAKQRDDP